jgi:uncharacterized protein (TIGR02145 family)
MKISFRIVEVFLLIFLFHSCKKDDDNSIKDGDGNVYTFDTIGNQVWLVENLRATKYNDGTTIPLITDSTEWVNLSTPGYCWYNNDIANKDTYGALYNWYTVQIGYRNICPTGWHVPSQYEWFILKNYLGGDSIAGGKLKEAGTSHWISPNTGATNETGFTALPGGGRYAFLHPDSWFDSISQIGKFGAWWSTTVATPIWCDATYMTYSSTVAGLIGGNIQNCGFYVRCLKD